MVKGLFFCTARSFGWLALGLVIFMVSCTDKKSVAEGASQSDSTRVYRFRDSCQHLVVDLSLELPLGEDSASLLMRDSLIADFVRSATHPDYCDQEGTQYVPDGDDALAIVNGCGKWLYGRLLQEALADYKERMAYLDSDTTLSAEDRRIRQSDVPQWEFRLAVRRQLNTERFLVFDSQIYCYYGGAHGGVGGTGAITFDCATGRKVGRFLRAEATAALQPLIRRGLIQYYSQYGESITDSELSERLQIQSPLIPLPSMTARPNAMGDSLVLTYGQYEIACYADGMPTFSVAVSDVEPYLTPEGRALLQRFK